MTEPDREPDRRTWDWDDLASAAGVATVVAGVLYAYGWVVLAQFYGSFDVSPEEVGVTFAFVTVRVALVMAVLAVLVALVLLPLRVLARARFDGRRLPLTGWSRFVGSLRRWEQAGSELRSLPWRARFTWRVIGRFVAALAVAGFVGYLATALGLAVSVGVLTLVGVDVQNIDPESPVASWAAGITFATPVVLGLVILGVNRTVNRIQHGSFSFARLARVFFALFLTITVVALLAPIWLLPPAMAETVRSRNLAAPVPFLWVVGLRADGVDVTTADGGPVSPRVSGGCVRLLGSANGVTVLFDPAQQLLVRVPSERLLIERPCR